MNINSASVEEEEISGDCFYPDSDILYGCVKIRDSATPLYAASIGDFEFISIPSRAAGEWVGGAAADRERTQLTAFHGIKWILLINILNRGRELKWTIRGFN